MSPVTAFKHFKYNEGLDFRSSYLSVCGTLSGLIIYVLKLDTTLRPIFYFLFSIFTAKACAIELTLNIISSDKLNRFVIFSDSLSVLISVKNKRLENPLIVKFLSRLDSMSSHKDIIMCWIPSYIGVNENERADLAAKPP